MTATIEPKEATVEFSTPFTQVIDVLVEDSELGEPVPSTTIPVVTRSFDDPGVTVTTAPGQVTISGIYRKIIVTNWEYLDLQRQQKSTDTTPEIGTFTMITKVDSPVNLKEDCIYTIDGATFTHTVDLVSYTKVGDKLKELLAAVS